MIELLSYAEAICKYVEKYHEICHNKIKNKTYDWGKKYEVPKNYNNNIDTVHGQLLFSANGQSGTGSHNGRRMGICGARGWNN